MRVNGKDNDMRRTHTHTHMRRNIFICVHMISANVLKENFSVALNKSRIKAYVRMFFDIINV